MVMAQISENSSKDGKVFIMN